jgi:hypothetical protein
MTKRILTAIIRHAIHPRGKKGKTMKRILLALMILAAPLAAQNDTNRWVRFFSAANDSTGYLDNQTISYRPSDSQYATVWVRLVEPSGEYGLIHFEMHATTRHMRSLSYARYDANHQQITSSFDPSTWDDVIPESLADSLLHRLYRFPAPAPPTVRY